MVISVQQLLVLWILSPAKARLAGTLLLISLLLTFVGLHEHFRPSQLPPMHARAVAPYARICQGSPHEWVEFASKSAAKKVAQMLNGEPMGGKRRSAYYYDLWNIKYLKKFKWDNLTEEIAYRNAVREQKQAADLSAAKRERDFYLAKVDQSKAISAMEERKKKRQRNDEPPTAVPDADEPLQVKPKIVRHFPQKKSVAVSESGAAPRLSRDVLAAVIGKR